MNRAPDLDAVADACLAAHAVIADHGTPQMKMLIRVLLHIVGREIAQDLPTSPGGHHRTPGDLGALGHRPDGGE